MPKKRALVKEEDVSLLEKFECKDKIVKVEKQDGDFTKDGVVGALDKVGTVLKVETLPISNIPTDSNQLIKFEVQDPDFDIDEFFNTEYILVPDNSEMTVADSEAIIEEDPREDEEENLIFRDIQENAPRRRNKRSSKAKLQKTKKKVRNETVVNSIVLPKITNEIEVGNKNISGDVKVLPEQDQLCKLDEIVLECDGKWMNSPAKDLVVQLETNKKVSIKMDIKRKARDDTVNNTTELLKIPNQFEAGNKDFFEDIEVLPEETHLCKLDEIVLECPEKWIKSPSQEVVFPMASNKMVSIKMMPRRRLFTNKGDSTPDKKDFGAKNAFAIADEYAGYQVTPIKQRRKKGNRDDPDDLDKFFNPIDWFGPNKENNTEGVLDIAGGSQVNSRGTLRNVEEITNIDDVDELVDGLVSEYHRKNNKMNDAHSKVLVKINGEDAVGNVNVLDGNEQSPEVNEIRLECDEEWVDSPNPDYKQMDLIAEDEDPILVEEVVFVPCYLGVYPLYPPIGAEYETTRELRYTRKPKDGEKKHCSSGLLGSVEDGENINGTDINQMPINIDGFEEIQNSSDEDETKENIPPSEWNLEEDKPNITLSLDVKICCRNLKDN